MSDDASFGDVYDELRRVAAAKLSHEGGPRTLTPTALVHEAWARLTEGSAVWNDKQHYIRLAATAMRRILIDRARARLADKRGGGLARVPFDDVAAPAPAKELLALDEALDRLAASKPDHARLVELRFFGGLTGDEAAEALGISPASADRMWRFARAWLKVEAGE